ncbi:hypothetical protein BVRB_9g207810 [Beta vulgaris subsp. vulgaris]|nr:hypothetical protein BVRB_9g207810 [Beta vulgaris subsp. vulgaris]
MAVKLKLAHIEGIAKEDEVNLVAVSSSGRWQSCNLMFGNFQRPRTSIGLI